MTKNDKDGQTTENMYEKKTLEPGDVLYLPCLGHLGLFFNQKKGHLGHLAYIYMTCSMCPPVKINQKSSQDSAK